MAKIIKYGQYLVVFCCLIVFFYILKDFNSANLKNIISRINYFWIFVAMVFAAVNILFKIFRLTIIAEQFNYRSEFGLSYKTQVISLIFALLTPGRVGEISKVYLLSQNNKENYPVVTSIMLFEILIDFQCIAFISFAFVIFAMKNIYLGLAIFILIVAAFLTAFLIGRGSSFVSRLPDSLQSFFKYISSNKIRIGYKWYLTIPFTISAWCLDGFFQFFILKAVNIQGDAFLLVALSAISSIISVISILPLGFGVTDLSSLYLYKTFQGLNQESILYLVNSSRLFLVLTLFIMAIPFLKLLYKRDWFKQAQKEG